MGLLSKIKEQAALPAPMVEAPADLVAPLQETTHLGHPATLVEVDEDGHAWYRTTREDKNGLRSCLVRDVSLNVEIPFDRS